MGIISSAIICIGIAGNVQVIERNGHVEFLKDHHVQCENQARSTKEQTSNAEIIKTEKMQFIVLQKDVPQTFTMPSIGYSIANAYKDVLKVQVSGDNMTLTLLQDVSTVPLSLSIDEENYVLDIFNGAHYTKESLEERFSSEKSQKLWRLL